MKNIGILVYDASLTGGAEKVAINLAQDFSKRYKVHLISLFNERNFQRDIKFQYEYFILNNKTVNITLNLFQLSKKLKKYLIENNIDVLLCITAGINTIAIMATRNTDIKTVYCEHSNLENKTYGKKHQLRQYLGVKYMDKIVTLTERDKNNFINLMNVSKDKVMCITNYFNCEKNNKLVYNKEAKKIITVGRLEKVKGYDMLIKVAKLVQSNHPDWKWDIYGDGKYRKKIENDIKDNDLEKFIELKGNVKNLNKIYNEYSIFVLTSYYEGLPLVLLEAQMAKLPIVSFDCPTGPSEIVENNKNGYIVKCYDIELMANKICELIENEDERENFSKDSQINFSKFDKENIIKQWIEFIENI